MVASSPINHENVVASVDVPTGYPPEMNAHYDAIIAYVEGSPHEIGVSGAYRYQKQCKDEGSQYCCRAGYHFRFWFFDKDVATDFAKAIGGRYEDPPVLPGKQKGA